MRTSFKKSDVTVLLKDITGLVTPLDTAAREAKIQRGTHYSEMLPLEYTPSSEYMAIYQMALQNDAQMTAAAVGAVSEKIYAEKGRDAVLVSLARAGTPIGILIKRYLQTKYLFSPPHYTISIIRGRGIDKNAMATILKRHPAHGIQFVDGWIGKGAIQKELNEAMRIYPGVSPGLAVLSDPAAIAEKYGTQEDFLIPSSCLNSTVSGLMSRTFYRNDIISADDFHGAVYYGELLDEDLTYQFIDTIQSHFSHTPCPVHKTPGQLLQESGAQENLPGSGLMEVKEISKVFGIEDLNLIKPSIGEATRVLLRRIPWKVLVHSLEDTRHLAHIYKLASEKGVEVVEYPLKNYKACGLIRSLSDI